MDGHRKQILGLFVALLVAGAVHADMMPVFKLDATRQQSVGVCGGTEAQHTHVSGPYDSRVLADFDFGAVPFLPKAGADVRLPSQIPHTIDLTGGPGSYTLCLYALIGLGMCSAPHWMRRLSLVHIPAWYHNGGPFQIGHRFAVPPESLCPVAVCCFVQPVWAAERPIAQYRLRAIVASWRKSQSTPDVIPSLGPPLRSS